MPRAVGEVVGTAVHSQWIEGIFIIEGAIIAARASSQTQVIAQAIERVLRPLVRLLVRYQIGFPFVSQRLKALYLDAALAEGGGSDSRLSLLTGVHRKDVRRFREDPFLFENGEKKGISLAAQVVAAWRTTAIYTDDRGEPLPLYRTRNAGEPNFEDLVDGIARQDVRSRAVCDELLRNQSVVELPSGQLQLNAQAFVPGADFAARADFFASGLIRHIDAASSNLQGQDPVWLERGVYANNLTSVQIANLHAYASQQAQILLRDLNNKARQMQKLNKNLSKPVHRFHFGVFFHAQEQTAVGGNEAEQE